MNGGNSPVDAPNMLLPSEMAAGAEKDMNPEWNLAKSTESFAPQLNK